MSALIPKNYLVITIEDAPKVELIDENDIGSIILLASPIFHSWLRSDEAGVIGIRFSSWMINQTLFTREERNLITKWNQSKSDFELFFGKNKQYNADSSMDETVKSTAIVKVDKKQHGLSFPLFGENIDKGEMMKLESKLGKRAPAQ